MKNRLLDDEKETTSFLQEWKPWIIILSIGSIFCIIGFLPFIFLMDTPLPPIETEQIQIVVDSNLINN